MHGLIDWLTLDRVWEVGCNLLAVQLFHGDVEIFIWIVFHLLGWVGYWAKYWHWCHKSWAEPKWIMLHICAALLFQIWLPGVLCKNCLTPPLQRQFNLSFLSVCFVLGFSFSGFYLLQITTTDGFWLGVQRINSRSVSGQKGPVFLNHGVLSVRSLAIIFCSLSCFYC